MKPLRISGLSIGGNDDPLALIAGPCVIESLDLCREVAAAVSGICRELGVSYIFKASFDKANRTSAGSFRGDGMEQGIEILAKIKAEFDVPVLTDVHESYQCAPVAEVADILQIPAFLSRQTDLLLAAAATGRAMNIKKGQFLAPWDVQKTSSRRWQERATRTSCSASAGLASATTRWWWTCVASRSCASSDGLLCSTARTPCSSRAGRGQPPAASANFIPHLVRAALATGAVDALFIETHPDPRACTL